MAETYHQWLPLGQQQTLEPRTTVAFPVRSRPQRLLPVQPTMQAGPFPLTFLFCLQFSLPCVRRNFSG